MLLKLALSLLGTETAVINCHFVKELLRLIYALQVNSATLAFDGQQGSLGPDANLGRDAITPLRRGSPDTLVYRAAYMNHFLYYRSL